MKNPLKEFALLFVATAALRCAAQNTYPYPSSGNIGLGTTSPTNLLTVSGTGMNPLIISIVTDITTGSAAGLAAAADTTRLSILAQGSARTSTSRYGLILAGWDEIADLNQGTGMSNGLAIGVQAASPIIFATANTERMRIDGTGHVGIGTTNSLYPLAVNGTIEAKEVIVQSGWSDYVLAPTFHLESLENVAASIRKEGHLPGVPSAKEIAEHGAKVGEIQTVLLAKIEELTLHAIEQERRIDEQAHRNDELAEIVKKLRQDR